MAPTTWQHTPITAHARRAARQARREATANAKLRSAARYGARQAAMAARAAGTPSYRAQGGGVPPLRRGSAYGYSMRGGMRTLG
jgi:hypothetical protein